MTRHSLVPIAILASSLAVFAAPPPAELAAKPLQAYPKNLARQHVGANLFIFNATTQSFTPTEAAAAWLDDDVTTGWPIMAGKQHYLLALPEPEVMTNFAISTRATAGTMTLFAADEPALPGARSWAPLAKEIALEAINGKKLTKPFNRFAKYLLIETNIADPGPLFSLYVFGERPATSYLLAKRDQAIDTKALFGYTNDQTAISHTGLYLGTRVVFASSGGGSLALQKAIDDNPESGVSIAPNAESAGLAVKFAGAPSISRVALLTAAPSKGQVDFFLVPALSSEDGVVPIAGLKPTASITLDGSTTRQAVDFPATEAGALLVRWVPESGSSALGLRELNAFNALPLSEYSLGMTPEAVAELVKNNDVSKDGKSFKDGKDLAPVGELRPSRSPYLPGALGFPPNITGRVPPPLPPNATPGDE